MRRLVNKGYKVLERNPVTGMLVAAGLGAVSMLFVGALAIYSQETFVQKTACSRDPSSAACAEIREEIARAEPIRNPCISYQRVTDARGRNCPKDFTGRRTRRHRTSSAAAGAELGGDAPQPADEAGQEPSPAPAGGKGGTKPPEGGEGGGEPTHGPQGAPETPATPAAPATGSPAGEAAPSNEPAAEVDQEGPQETEQVKPGLIGNPGGVVGEVTCGLGQLTEVAGIRVCTSK